MREFTFVAYCSFGKGDSGETWIDVELTDEEAEQLIKYGTQPDIFYNGFNECEELSELYDKIYEIAIEQITDELRDADWIDEEDRENPEWRADDLYSCGINFPDEFEEMLVEEDE
jgi:hypothetical protein